MSWSRLAICIAAAASCLAGSALAQPATRATLRRATVARPIADEYNEYDYYQQDPNGSPSDKAPVPDAPAPNGSSCCEPACGAEPSCCANNSCNGCNHCCGSCCDWCHLGEPWVLFDCCCLKAKHTVIKGWVNAGITYNHDDPDDGFNGPQTFNDRANEFQGNQLYVYIERAPNTECQHCDWGYRVDLLYGTDWRTTPAVGLEINQDGTRNWNQDHRFYGLAVPQVYASTKLNDLEVRVGRIYTSAGYEVVTSTGNFFYSHAYTHQYGEPFTHTGVMSMFQVSDTLSVHACIHRGWDQWEDINDDPSLLAGFTWTSCDKKTSFAYAMTYGNEANDLFFTNTQNRYYQGIVFTRQLNDNLKYVAHSDYGHQQEVNGAGTPDAEWYSITQYLIYKVNDCLSYGFRYEWFRDDDGFRVFGLGSAEFAAGVPSPMGFIGGGYAGNFQDISFGINYKPNANLIIRPEVRYDWYDGLASGVNGRPLPFNTGTDDQQFTIAADLIYTF